MTPLLHMTTRVTYEQYATQFPDVVGRIDSTTVLVPGKTLLSI